MFLQNKYTIWYNKIIDNAKSRLLEGYSEIHHIVPRSLGGTDDPGNLIQLTAREHFICHLLLTKMVSGSSLYKMQKAAQLMCYISGPGQQRYKTTNRIYELLKMSLEVPEEVRLKMSTAQKNRFSENPGTFLGKQHTGETRKKMSLSASKPKSELWKQSASNKRKGKPAPNKGKPHTEETKLKISKSVTGEKNGFFGKHHSEEQRQKKREEKLAAPKKMCYYCNKETDPMNYSRWHGDKCKQKK
jgi:hypothetical protein